MPAYRQDAAAGTTDITEQTPDDRGCTDHLDPSGMVGPAHRVADRAPPLATRVARQSPCNFDDSVSRAGGGTFHHVGRVGRVLAAQDLVDAMRMLQCRIAGGGPFSIRLVFSAKLSVVLTWCSARDTGTTSPWYCQESYL